MKIALLMVSTIDGRLTRGNSGNIYKWSSPEDFHQFQKIKRQHKLLVMGSKTYNEMVKQNKSGLKPQKGRLRVILTKNPQLYKKESVEGMLEFSNETPRKLVDRLKKLGHKKMLLLGGGRVASSFLKHKLISEVWITFEPKIFGNGEQLRSERVLDCQFELKQVKRLNAQGTLLLKYLCLNTFNI